MLSKYLIDILHFLLLNKSQKQLAFFFFQKYLKYLLERWKRKENINNVGERIFSEKIEKLGKIQAFKKIGISLPVSYDTKKQKKI